MSEPPGLLSSGCLSSVLMRYSFCRGVYQLCKYQFYPSPSLLVTVFYTCKSIPVANNFSIIFRYHRLVISCYICLCLTYSFVIISHSILLLLQILLYFTCCVKLETYSIVHVNVISTSIYLPQHIRLAISMSWLSNPYSANTGVHVFLNGGFL